MPTAPPASYKTQKISYLALGDSYTIGESVLLTESFPYQVTHLLRRQGKNFQAPEIIARTGWTTDELQKAIDGHAFLAAYDYVTLLIGVNNQYRGRSVEEYAAPFTALLQQAIRFAGGVPDHVMVVSIPDWSATPFAEGRDRKQIGKEIDAYNAVNRGVAAELHTLYIDITEDSREATHRPELVAADGLHPSAIEYGRWAKKISDVISSRLQP